VPELVPSKSLPQVQFVVSLPLSLMSAMSLICSVPYFEGLDAWLSETRQRLEPAFLGEMALVLGFPGRFQRFTEEVYATVLAEDPVLSYEAFVERLCALPEETCVKMAHRAVAKSLKPPLSPEAVQTLLQNSVALSKHLRLADLRIDLGSALAFLKDLTQLKLRFVTVVERFWQKVYHKEWTATRPMMEQSVTFHRRQCYRLNFPDLFVAVTGRLLPKAHAELTPGQVRFVPSCYIGPYFTLMNHAGRLSVFYNCRASPLGQWPGAGPGLFPLLKALADETRLQIMEMLRGQEMYAQQIVNRLAISQAAVSRHLKLMVHASVLRVRREGGAKFYSVNVDTLAYLADALQKFGE
jgi:DNA-binding transcriptional ArsR family regulator